MPKVARNLAATCAILFALTLAASDIPSALHGHFRLNWDQLVIVVALAAGVAVFLGASVRFIALVLIVTIVRSWGFFKLGLLAVLGILIAGGHANKPILLPLLFGAVVCPIVGLVAALAADPLWRRAQAAVPAKEF